MKELKYTELEPQIAAFATNETTGTTKVTLATFEKRAQSAITELLNTDSSNPLMLLSTIDGANTEQCIRDLLTGITMPHRELYDLCYAENLDNALAPVWLHIKSGTSAEFSELMSELFQKVKLKVDAEKLLLRILKKQGDNPKLENYLSDLSIYVAQGREFTHPVPMNLLVRHDADRNPVIFGTDITWKRLFGGVNYLTENGSTYSNHHLLEPGLLRQADGGILVLRAEELVRNPMLWFKLKNVLSRGLLDWDSPSSELVPGSVVPFFNPEATPINVKVIITASYYDIAELYHYDPTFNDAIYLRTDLNSYFDLKEHTQNFYQYLDYVASRNNLLPFTEDAKRFLIREACRLAESQLEFVINEHCLLNVMREASGYARRADQAEVTLKEVQTANQANFFRLSSMVEESTSFYKNKQMLLQTDGQVTGQINGLSVVQTLGEDFEYGEPIRITATIHNGGDGDIADIEHKAELAGQIHTKAMMIINGFLTNTFGYNESIPVSANLVFEQSYSEIDGDSASLTGLCAILSAMAGKPIHQTFAVTGAVDQFGNVQPVGGVNKKIEGYYRICKIQGLNGRQGVIIPESNIQALTLDQEIIDAVKAGQFHVWAVKNVNDAIELLTGIPGGFPDKTQEEAPSQSSEEAKATKKEAQANDKEDSDKETLYDIIALSLDSNNRMREGCGLLSRILGFFGR